MKAIYLDSSALARRYFIEEPGSERVNIVATAAEFSFRLVSRLTSVEFAAALARREEEGSITAEDRNRLWIAYAAELRERFRVLPLSEEVLTIAEGSRMPPALRSLDRLHVASALLVARWAAEGEAEFLFMTADRRQAEAATWSGLSVEILA